MAIEEVIRPRVSWPSTAQARSTKMTNWRMYFSRRLDLSRFYTARVKLRRTQCEHMFSALPSNSDIDRSSRHFSNGPTPDSCIAAKERALSETEISSLAPPAARVGGVSSRAAFAEMNDETGRCCVLMVPLALL
jgi:hypothetical protein